MPKRQQKDQTTRTGERSGDQPKRRPSGADPSKEHGTGRSWVHDEPPLEQGDDPQRSGYSDRETPEATPPGARPGRQGERPAKR